MKRLKQHWSARPLSWLLSAAMIWPVLLFMLGSAPAQAQTALNGTPTWAILDFENHSGYGGAEVGRIASDAFVVELGKSNKYGVLSRQETQQGIANIGLTEPLDGIGLQRLGRDLTAAAVATGEVAAVSFSSNPRQATASVIIRVVDTSTGELVNGALAQGRSNARAINTNDDDALVNEAINNAAFAAVRQITQFNLPKATVLISRDQNSVVLNRGTRDGLFDGLNMVVTRNGSEVGRIRVGDAQADQSNAIVTRRGLGIQPQDKATAIYQLPAYTVSHQTLQARNTDVASDGAKANGKRSIFSGVTGIFLAILAGALLFSLIKRGNGSLGGAEIGKPLAVEGRADVLGGQGLFPGVDVFSIAGGKVVRQNGNPPPQYTPVVVRITASTNQLPGFIEYHVYRSDFPPLLQDAVVFAAETGSTTSVSSTSYGQIPIFSATGPGDLLVFDDGADKEGITASKPKLDFGTTAGGGNTVGTGIQTFAFFGGLPGSGIQFVGQRIQYFIEGLYTQPATTGTSAHAATFQLTGRASTNFVTYIMPVHLGAESITSPSGTAGSDTIINVIATPPTITENVLELSNTPGFQKKYVFTPQDTGSTTVAPYITSRNDPQFATDTPGASHIIFYLRNTQGTSTRDLRLTTLFPSGGPVFARVGTRDPLNGSSQTANPFIYSDPVQIPF